MNINIYNNCFFCVKLAENPYKKSNICNIKKKIEILIISVYNWILLQWLSWLERCAYIQYILTLVTQRSRVQAPPGVYISLFFLFYKS
jgi:hypothetical protein